MELKNALAEWNTATKNLPSTGSGLLKTNHPLCRVEIFLKPALAKNPAVVRDFKKDTVDLQEIQNQLTHVYVDADKSWQFKLAHEKDPKKQAANKAIFETVLKCLHGILEALARQIKADNDLRDGVNKALDNVFKTGDYLVHSPNFADAKQKEKLLTDAIKHYDSLTVHNESWKGPAPRYWPKETKVMEIVGKIAKLAEHLVTALLKTQANLVDEDRREMKKWLQQIHVQV